jgi:hypothetical protein
VPGKKALFLGEHTQTQPKVIEFHKKFYNTPKPWIVEKKNAKCNFGNFSASQVICAVVTEIGMSVSRTGLKK